jgi:sulfite exporter TauE/SafE
MTMGRSLLLWFLFCLVVSVFVAYLATPALSRGADAMAVFRFTTTPALLGYGFTSVMKSIWKGSRWTVTAKFVFDGILYAECTEFCQRKARALQVSQ